MPHNSELLMDKVEGAGIRTNFQWIQNQGRPIMSKEARAIVLRHLLGSSTPLREDKESTLCLLISRLMRNGVARFFGFVALLVSRFVGEGEGVGLYWIFVGLLNCGLMGFW